MSASKVLRFYDAALLANLALLHQGAAEFLLEQAAADARLKTAAGFVLAETRLAAGRAAAAGQVLRTLAVAELPAAYRERVALMQASVDVQTGQAARGNAAFAEFARRHGADPQPLGEALAACVAARGVCTSLADAATALAATGQGERFRGLYAALGEFHAASGRTERALGHLETARDKANKNRIDTNDPLLLVRLADLYLATRSFSENLEIYFELSREFPAVRALQEAGQGVYATEYRSAGDVKIF